jgi:hypothetical protein
MDPTYPKEHPVEHTIEECAELIHALQKAKRFGWDNYKPGNTRANRLLVIMEIRDVEDSLVALKTFVEHQLCSNISSSPNTSNTESVK